MGQSILIAVVVLSSIGVISAVVLYFVAKKFKVEEDPLVDEIADVLPGANCGGCGFAGCRAFAEAVVKQGNMEGLRCAPGGNATLAKIAKLLGVEVGEDTPKVAVLRCNGSIQNSPSKSCYDGLRDCKFVNELFVGEGGCKYGCLGMGNCASVCKFDAIVMDKVTGLPIIDEEKCTSCGACVKECPRSIIELRNKGIKGRMVFVSCVNKEKGGVAKRNCSVACIGCGKCEKVCKFDAITIENNLAYIDFNKCKLCKKCVDECPTGAIHAINFPAQKTIEVNSPE